MTGRAPLRPLVLINSLWQGGAEQSTTDSLLRLAQAGMEPEVICIRDGVMPLADALRDAGIPVTHLDRRTDLDSVRRLRRRLQDHPPDLLHVILFESAVLGTLAARGTGIPVLASIASTPSRPSASPLGIERLKRRAVLTVERAVYRRAAAVHAVTAGVAASAVDVLGVDPARTSVVERGRSPERFPRATAAVRAATRARLGLPEQAEVVLCVGRHEPDKGFELLPAVFDHLDRPDLVVLVAGRDGSSTPAIKAALAGARNQDRVRLIGERTDIPELLAAADVFVLASRSEGAAGAALEAMATGTPIVARRLPGLEGVLVDGENAVVVPAGEDAALGDATVALLDDAPYASTLAGRAHQTFLDRFTLGRSAEELGRLYEQVARVAPHPDGRHPDPGRAPGRVWQTR